MPVLNPFPRIYQDEENNVDTESQDSIVFGSDEEAPSARTTPKWYRGGGPRPWNSVLKLRALGSRLFSTKDPEQRARKRLLWRKLFIVFLVLSFFGAVAAITYISLVAALIHRLNPPKVNSGLQYIVDTWKPDSTGAYKFEWRDDFSRDIIPKNCHSHNDYWRSVPLYEALAAGCVSVEADIWLTDDNELLVSHSWKSTKRERTLKSLYLDPLTTIFTKRNVSVASTADKDIGMFDTAPNVSTILLIDFKSDGHKTWPVLLEQLQPLREQNWLTYFDGEQLVRGPLTVVGTGNTPFDLVQQNNTNRFIFFDAPLDDISNPSYTSQNSYYASIAMNEAIGRLWTGSFSSRQIDALRGLIEAAKDKALVSRYWDTPSWPISLRDKVWFQLTDMDVGMLNVDALTSATRWNWNWCTVAGLNLCGNR